MTFWETLEIDYGSDLKTIKKAYALLLKVNNPEVNPEDYQWLRQAYDEAIKNKKKRNSNTKENLEFSYSQVEKEIKINPYIKIKL